MGMVTALAAVAAASGIYGGIQAQKEGDKQARLAESAAAERATETRRQTERSAEIEQRNIDQTEDRQRLNYLASGVTLEGSPLLKLEETRRLGAENIDEIQKAGEAGAKAQLTEGRTRAQAAKSTGRQALISGITGAAGTLGTNAPALKSTYNKAFG